MPTRRERQALMAYIRKLPKTLEEVDIAASPNTPRYCVRAWRSRYFTAQLYDEPNGLRLSVQRATESLPFQLRTKELPISWDELMEVKRQAGLGDHWASELYPPDDQVVDLAPMRHLWIHEEEPAFGWRAGVNERQP